MRMTEEKFEKVNANLTGAVAQRASRMQRNKFRSSLCSPLAAGARATRPLRSLAPE